MMCISKCNFFHVKVMKPIYYIILCYIYWQLDDGDLNISNCPENVTMQKNK